MPSPRTSQNSGFTILEIIVAIAISSILAVMIVQISTNNTTRSYLPLANLNRQLALQEVVEEMAADYRLLVDTDPTPLVELQSRIKEQRYWAKKSFGPNIKVTEIKVTENYCFEFVLISGTDWKEGNDLGDCGENDNNLKVTLTYGSPATQSLTTVFSR